MTFYRKIISLKSTQKYIFCAFMLISVFNDISAQKLRTRSTSVLNSGDWYKIAVPSEGVYRIDYEFLTDSLDISSNDLNFSTLGVYGYGGGAFPEDNSHPFINDLPENSIQIVDNNNNGKLEPGDYLLFYADGKFRWDFNPTDSLMYHTSAYYTDFQHFFITTMEGSRKEIRPQTVGGTPQRTIFNYQNYNTNDYDSINPNNSGRIWFRSAISNQNKSVQVTSPIAYCELNSKYIIRYAYYTEIPSATLNISIDGSLIKSKQITADNNLQYDTIITTCPGISPRITFNINQSIDQNFYFDFIEINAISPAQYRDNPMTLFTTEELGTNNLLAYQISHSTPIQVWDISKSYEPISVGLTGSGSSKFNFFNSIGKRFYVFSNSDIKTPISVGKIENQNIADLATSNYIIITHKNWKDVAEKLAEFHREESGISVNVVDVEEIYNEYSSGNKDVTAIRRFVMNQYNSGSSTDDLKYLLLFGNACLDYKNIRGEKFDFIPTYETNVPADFLESFCTDDYYALLESNETNLNSTATLDIGIGRLPVVNKMEAEAVFNKIKAYKSKESYGDWRNETTIVADDYDETFDAAFYTQNQAIAGYIESQAIKTNLEKLYIDAFNQEQFSGGQRYEDAEKILKDKFTFGNLLTTYIGHGGPQNWAQERLLSSSDLDIYQNLNNLPFLTTATCGFASYDQIKSDKSAGEKYILQDDGGAIGLLTTCREVLIRDQGPFMDNFIKEFFRKNPNGTQLTFGDVAKNTKNSVNVNLNSQKVVLLGDPALTINFPKFNIVTTSISNGTDDTLKSLSKVKIRGEIRDLNNTKMSDFNGVCQVTVLDKKSLRKLKYNDTKDPLIPNDTFTVQTNRIFKGSTDVVNGEFEINFVVPKDINYAMGRGKISYYAADVNNKPYRDASGMDTNVWVGGANLNADSDNEPPKVQLFMNDENFAFGGITDENPIMLAKLSDDNGINTTGIGVGHDITAILDDNQRVPIILNNYYNTLQNDFTQGTIDYPFYQLEDGLHTLKVKAWDVYNNPGEGYIEFIVAKNEGLAIKHLLNYPNPFTSNTLFQFEHNRPNQILDVSINVMTITGKVVKRIHRKITTDGYRISSELPWDGKDDYGDKIGRGIYVYVVSVRDEAGEQVSEYQKLVLLQ